MSVKPSDKRARVAKSATLVVILNMLLSSAQCSPALADTQSDFRHSLQKGDDNLLRDRDAALKYYEEGLALAKKDSANDKSGDMLREASRKLGNFYLQGKQYSLAEKYLRESTRLGEANKTSHWGDQALAYEALGQTLQAEGKTEEGHRLIQKAETFRRDSMAASNSASEKAQLKQMLSDYEQCLKSPGAKYPYYKGRELARWYADHNQFDKAVIYCEKVVEFCRDPKNYFDSGAEWDERRKNGVPMEGTETIMVGGKPTTVYVLDNRRPSGKLDRSGLVRCLVALSLIDEKLGKTKEATQAIEEAKQNYTKYQMENPSKLLQSFDAFVTESEHWHIVGQPKISALLSWI
jgi:tetratricopeptide (TPR) repeat protein